MTNTFQSINYQFRYRTTSGTNASYLIAISSSLSKLFSRRKGSSQSYGTNVVDLLAWKGGHIEKALDRLNVLVDRVALLKVKTRGLIDMFEGLNVWDLSCLSLLFENSIDELVVLRAEVEIDPNSAQRHSVTFICRWDSRWKVPQCMGRGRTGPTQLRFGRVAIPVRESGTVYISRDWITIRISNQPSLKRRLALQHGRIDGGFPRSFGFNSHSVFVPNTIKARHLRHPQDIPTSQSFEICKVVSDWICPRILRIGWVDQEVSMIGKAILTLFQMRAKADSLSFIPLFLYLHRKQVIRWFYNAHWSRGSGYSSVWLVSWNHYHRLWFGSIVPCQLTKLTTDPGLWR